MKITHIYHSGFVIELESTVLIFDWYSGELPDFDPGKKVFVFVTHGHADHYSSRIWTLRGMYQNICNIFHVQPGRHYRIRNTLVYAIRSNDEGVAYVVSAEGYNFFHAGDLNIWHWKDAQDDQNAYSLKIYRRQIEKISSWSFDAAMLPLDPRLEDKAPNAIIEFLSTVECRHLFPMHYWNRQQEAAGYLRDVRLDPFRDRICFLSEMEVQ